eukprot:Partr_v1_DN29001_c0_g1_i1_m58823 putative RNA pseudouridylate synthase domain containing
MSLRYHDFTVILLTCLRIIYALVKNHVFVPLISTYRRYWLERNPSAFDAEFQSSIVLPIVEHSAHFLIVNKPADVNITRYRSSAPEKVHRPTVESILNAEFPHYHLRNVHQLDYATSGIYCIALTKAAASHASAMFRQRRVSKTYLAIVNGHITDWSERVIDSPIGSDPCAPGQMKVRGENAKDALTHCKLLKTGYFGSKPCSLVALFPRTGRTHQLRVHMAHLGHSIIGDLFYESPVTPSSRMMLHAWKIHIQSNPSSGYVHDTGLKSKSRAKSSASRLCAWLRGYLAHLKRESSSHLDVVAETPDPFNDFYIKDTPETSEERAFINHRMSRHEWVTENLPWKRHLKVS